MVLGFFLVILVVLGDNLVAKSIVAQLATRGIFNKDVQVQMPPPPL